MDTTDLDGFDSDEFDGIAYDVDEAGFDRATFVKGALAAGALAGLHATPAFAATPPAPRGTLRLGIIGSATEAFDPHQQRSLPDLVRNAQIFEGLVDVNGAKVVPRLAESWELYKKGSPLGSQWVVRLRKGMTFHNGKAVTADDVLWSFRRVKAKGRGRAALDTVDMNATRKVDSRTILFQLTQPYSLFASGPLSGSTIIPDAQDTFTPDTAVGTGPFRLVQATPGSGSRYERFANYWQKGKPYLNELQLIYFSDITAKLNALLAGQLDAIDSIQPSQVDRAKGAGLKILTAKGGVWNPLVMDTTQEPFTDNRVRLAMKLIADRPLMLRNALGGFGELGNDIFTTAAFDPAYDKSLPQRKQDIAQAKALLKAAGKENLNVTLHTSDVALGLVSASLIFAQEAAKAGVTVNVRQYSPDVYYSGPYLKESFYVSNWSTKTLDRQSLQCIEGGFLETKWKNQRFTDLMSAARRTFVEKKRAEFYHEADKILRNQGGYIIYGFQDSLDAASKKYVGFSVVPGRAFGGYNFRTTRLV